MSDRFSGLNLMENAGESGRCLRPRSDG